ncbi:PH domain-containing protein [Nostocaceae cyanobacterium CENA369]|uniref:PH domain-containing protein n=1 Tax=Dendronalium phyllosphericum CENA369 TaxID=1725256 RepID=A0A8J7LGM2_9NOST|nr:PH domain-containing protein [Dendronalium phyllosphericum]MBH8573114.1 PH domain-containing protein [Dendronalium phyllosphericum CENA369]
MGIREEIYYEGGPHIGDLILNLLIGLTVVGIPLAVGAIVRALWLRYRITDRRISVMGGWMGRDRTDVIYSEIVNIVKVPRGLGIWGDMVVTLRNGSRLEMRAVPKFREVYDYINEKVTAKNPQYTGAANK